ncbi:Beta-lactamase-like protein [Penicillium italicum]|uniref:Beta-lactamase-like protein n=1 Tax=Penicillium italicum TaxID=40296 RepID=A0A0A2L0T4_PENIT|nr:Beta-lactamase-like protein [Penicillium italicum]
MVDYKGYDGQDDKDCLQFKVGPTNNDAFPRLTGLGPAFPAPTALSEQPIFLSKAEELTSRLNEAVENGTIPSVSFAVQVFSSEEDDSAFGFYHTDDPIKVGSVGVQEVDENTMFRIGSISKLWTMFLFMTFEGTRSAQRKDSINYLKWSDVTIGELASHQAGLARDYAFGDFGFQSDLIQSMGFPSLPKNEQPTCGIKHTCNRKDRLIKPLNLTRSSLRVPDPSLAVIPHNESFSWFDFEFGDGAPVGNIFSSAKDMATFGRAVLSSTLVEHAVTRRWMKPVAHTSSLHHSVGAPWEIYSFLTPRRVDLYTKAGDLGLYSSSIALSPDHNAGFTVLLAGANSHAMTSAIGEMVADIMLPALDEVARNQALERFGGTYALTSGSSNFSITITADDEAGLVVSEWTNNSVDMIKSLMGLQGVTDRSAISIRLQPSGLETPGRISFLAVIYSLDVSEKAGPIVGSCFSWMLLESMVYGNVGLPEFEFALDHYGHATSLSPRALRVTLPRV